MGILLNQEFFSQGMLGLNTLGINGLLLDSPKTGPGRWSQSALGFLSHVFVRSFPCMTPAGIPWLILWGDLASLLHTFPSRSMGSAPLVLCTCGQSSYRCTVCAHVGSVWVAGWWGHKSVYKLCFSWAGTCKHQQQMYQSSGQDWHTMMSHAEHRPQRNSSLAPEKLPRVAWGVRVITGRTFASLPILCVPPRGTVALSWGLYFHCSFWVFVLNLTPSLFPFTSSLAELQVEPKTSRTRQSQ